MAALAAGIFALLILAFIIGLVIGSHHTEE
jgi:hypothetical protein